MKKIIGTIILIVFSFLFVSCTKKDFQLSDYIYDEYKNELESSGYNLISIDANNNVSGWLDITDDDVVNIHRTTGEGKDGVLYMYLFPTINNAEKWYDKIKEKTISTNYKVFLNGHYVVVVLGNKLNEIAESLSN